MMENRVIFVTFIGVSVISALAEGMSIALLVPILDAQSMGDSFSKIPVLKYVSVYFATMQGAEKLIFAAAALFVVVLFRGALQFSTQALSIMIPIKTQRGLTMNSYRHLMLADMGYINSHDTGDFINSIKDRPGRVTSLIKAGADIVLFSMILAIYTYLMMAISWKLTVLSIVVLYFFSWCMKKISALTIRKLGDATSRATSRLNQTLFETLEGMQLIRLRAAETVMLERFEHEFDETLRIQQKSGIYHAMPSPFLSTAVGMFICSLLYFGAMFAENDTQEITSQIILFMFLLMRLMGPVSGLNACRNAILANISALTETDKFMAEVQARIQPNGDIPFHKLTSKIKLQNVQYYYEDATKKAIQSLSATIQMGQMVAVIGPSGAGKSTLIGLLSRLTDPTAGDIFVNGINLRDYDVLTWRRKVSVVSQDIVLFNDTVENNIAFGLEGVTSEEVRAAAQMAAADTFIRELPLGYQTFLGDRGVRLSGGQKQRISIARAVLANPELLIMDEGTSHLDSVTEREIQRAVETLSHRCTIIVVAHRLSTIRRADNIIVMDRGRIVEEGKHDDLIALKGVYWDMLNHQRLDLIDENEGKKAHADS